jgi:plastocyanin
MKKIAINLLLMVALLCALGANAYAATVNVSIRDFFFSPQTIPVNVGDTITWTNNGFFLHSTTSGTSCPTPDGKWDSGLLSNGQSFSVTFTQAGTFQYFCTPHCFTGTVVVNPGAVASAPSGAQFFSYAPVVTPIVNTDLALARPLAIGPLAEGGDLINLQVALPQFQVPVDIYVILFSPTLDFNTIFNVTPDISFQNISLMQFLQSAAAGLPPDGMTPWMAGVIGHVDSTLFANIPASALPNGEYLFFVLVTLPNNLFNFDLFETDFTLK